MDKTIRLALSKYAQIPPSLAAPGSLGPKDEITVDMAGLFHHYYLDTRGYAPPNPDLAHFEHLAFFCADEKLRLKGDGIGSSVAFRISRSNDLGQAFCRWFLYSHLNITYFAHMHDVLDKPSTSASMGYTVQRDGHGELPLQFFAAWKTLSA